MSIPALDAAISWFSSVFIKANNLRTCLSVTNPPPLQCIGIRLVYCRCSGILFVVARELLIVARHKGDLRPHGFTYTARNDASIEANGRGTVEAGGNHSRQIDSFGRRKRRGRIGDGVVGHHFRVIIQLKDESTALLVPLDSKSRVVAKTDRPENMVIQQGLTGAELIVATRVGSSDRQRGAGIYRSRSDVNQCDHVSNLRGGRVLVLKKLPRNSASVTIGESLLEQATASALFTRTTNDVSVIAPGLENARPKIPPLPPESSAVDE